MSQILSTFQQTHDELAQLEKAHLDLATNHNLEVERIQGRVAELHNECAISASIRHRLSEFLPPKE